MAKYMYVFRGGAFVQKGLSPTDLQEHLGGNPVQASGRTIRGKTKTVTDGPYAELKDLVTGNLLINVASLDEATELAKGCPIFEFDGSVEVRPVAEM